MEKRIVFVVRAEFGKVNHKKLWQMDLSDGPFVMNKCDVMGDCETYFESEDKEEAMRVAEKYESKYDFFRGDVVEIAVEEIEETREEEDDDWDYAETIDIFHTDRALEDWTEAWKKEHEDAE